MIAEILTTLHALTALLLAAYTAGTVLLLLSYWQHRRSLPPPPPVMSWPSVVVQLPVYNERYVIKRLIDAVAQLDYPRDRLYIQLLDDSTDDTSAIAAAQVEALRAVGLQIDHIRRTNRAGYKAGALAHGLALTGCELVAVFDADFLPAPDFLRRTVPYFCADPRLGLVQTRWGHLNADANWLTRGQALALDGHFVVEQTARNRAGWLINFNGSAGLWRVDCIRAAGGWRDITLTEDLDLSYRAQLAGWRSLYLPDVVVPAELPPQLAAYKQQQARWAAGSTRVLLLLFGRLWRARLTLLQRLMAMHHLCQYLPHPLMLLLLLLTPPLLALHRLQALPLLGPLSALGLAPPLLYAASQRALYSDWLRRLAALPLLLALGIGAAWNNTCAMLSALLSPQPAEFRRTPKFAAYWATSPYALAADWSTLAEALLALYALSGAVLALRIQPALVPWLALYAYAFGLMAALGLRDRWLLQRSRRALHHTPALR